MRTIGRAERVVTSASPGSDHDQPALDISFVLPCLNEVVTVEACVEAAWRYIKRSGMTGEVIVVDNGSVDGSTDLALQAGAVIVVEPEPGYGRAVCAGLNAARGRRIVMGDADGTYDFDGIDGMVERLRAGADLVIGNRLQGEIEPGAMPWLHRNVGTPVISLLVRSASGARVRDSQSGMRLMTAAARDKLRLVSHGMELASEMILKAQARGLTIAEAPISYSVRGGESKLRTFRDGWRHLRLLLMLTPQMTFVAIAALFFLAGLAVLAIAAAATERLHWEPVFLGGILLVVGLNTFVLGGVARIHAVRRGLLQPDWLVRLFMRRRGIEVLGLFALMLFLTGVAIELLIFLSWVNGADGDRIWQGSLAQALILLGTNLGVVTLIVGLYQSEP